ncbi:hypothetical protein [Microbulbifer agarilyticus]
MPDLKQQKFNSENDSTCWWTLLPDDVELFIDTNSQNPSSEEIELAQASLDKIDELCNQALAYIDIWVDRTREGTGTDNWLSALFIYPHTRRGGQTKVQFGFTDDQDSIWWVLFNNPVPPYPGGKPRFHPIAFGREQG